ncbi:unnamed protein product, partial [Hapterophycus canaliculatus]
SESSAASQQNDGVEEGGPNVVILVKNLADDKRIIAQGNVPGIRRVLAQALKKGCSSQSILEKLENALSGSYHARGWTEEEKDLGLLILWIGGPSLLNVLHKTVGPPGLSQTREH